MNLGSARLGEIVLPINRIWFEHGDVMIECVGLGPLPAESGLTTYYGKDGEVVSVSETAVDIDAVPEGMSVVWIGQIKLTGHRERMRELREETDHG